MTTFHCPKCRKAFTAAAATAEQPQHVADELARSSAERCCWSPDCVDCGDAGILRNVRVDEAGTVYAIVQTENGPKPMHVTIIGGKWTRIDIVKEARKCLES